jgi:hypothetical protein
LQQQQQAPDYLWKQIIMDEAELPEDIVIVILVILLLVVVVATTVISTTS